MTKIAKGSDNMISTTAVISETCLTISYGRFSMPQQAKGDSTKRQRDLANDYVKENGLPPITDRFRLQDRGVSGFRGKNQNSGALSEFLAMVKSGEIPVGSILLVEDLDRLSRQAPEEALELFLGIIRAGIIVVTLIDRCEYRRGQLDMQRLMVSIMRICLAHEESAKKAMRLGKAWKTKRENILEKPLTSILPNWLEIVDGKISVVEDVAGKMRKMYQMVIDGLGTNRIAQSLDMGRSYVSKCLHNRQLIGEFQLHQLDYDAEGNKSRKPIGAPIQGYYPQVIDPKTFETVQRLMKSRRKDVGPSSQFVNLFKGILFSADDKTAMVVTNKGGDTGRQYVSSAAMNHQKGAAAYVAIPIAQIERDILSAVAMAKSMKPVSTEPVAVELAAVETQYAGVASQIGKLSAALATVGNVVAVVEAIAKLETEKKELDVRRLELSALIQSANREAFESDADEIRRVVAETKTLQLVVARGCRVSNQSDKTIYELDDHEGRERFRQHIRQIVSRIDIATAKKGHTRTARWTVTLRDGQTIRGEKTMHTRNDATLDKELQARKMWRQAVRPAEIAQQTEMSVSQVYRICKDVKREGKWTPHNRWDKR